jgi:hypothetical protein
MRSDCRFSPDCSANEPLIAPGRSGIPSIREREFQIWELQFYVFSSEPPNITQTNPKEIQPEMIALGDFQDSTDHPFIHVAGGGTSEAGCKEAWSAAKAIVSSDLFREVDPLLVRQVMGRPDDKERSARANQEVHRQPEVERVKSRLATCRCSALVLGDEEKRRRRDSTIPRGVPGCGSSI